MRLREPQRTRPAHKESPVAASKRILVVDDDERLCYLLRLTLADAAFEVAQANSGEDALAAAQTAPPDLIILDVGLQPGQLDGLEVCRQVRRNPALRGCRVVMLTANDDPQTRQAALLAGASDYFTKPFNPPTLRAWVRQALLG